MQAQFQLPQDEDSSSLNQMEINSPCITANIKYHDMVPKIISILKVRNTTEALLPVAQQMGKAVNKRNEIFQR